MDYLVIELLLWKSRVEKTIKSSLLAYITDFIQELLIYGSLIVNNTTTHQ